jgi:hypothetical protein
MSHLINLNLSVPQSKARTAFDSVLALVGISILLAPTALVVIIVMVVVHTLSLSFIGYGVLGIFALLVLFAVMRRLGHDIWNS